MKIPDDIYHNSFLQDWRTHDIFAERLIRTTMKGLFLMCFNNFGYFYWGGGGVTSKLPIFGAEAKSQSTHPRG